MAGNAIEPIHYIAITNNQIQLMANLGIMMANLSVRMVKLIQTILYILALQITDVENNVSIYVPPTRDVVGKHCVDRIILFPFGLQKLVEAQRGDVGCG
jgi:hypothetical protein